MGIHVNNDIGVRLTAFVFLCKERGPLAVSSYRYASQSTSEGDEPVKYSTSKAAKINGQDDYGSTSVDDVPWYQRQVVIISIGSFLVYFTMLREENDIDKAIPDIPGFNYPSDRDRLETTKN